MFFANLITDWIWPGDGVHSYHWFHIMWLVLMVIGCFASSYFLGRKHNKKIDDRFIFIIGTMLILIEIYKQVFYTLDAGYFQWYAFPFQFCSVPMYVAFVAPLIKNEKIKEYNKLYICYLLYSLCTYGIYGCSAYGPHVA